MRKRAASGRLLRSTRSRRLKSRSYGDNSRIFGIIGAISLVAILGLALSSRIAVVQSSTGPVAKTDRTPPTSSLVKFNNDQTKQTFLKQNNLTPAELKPVPQLSSYVVARQPERVQAPPTVSVYPNHKYTALITPNDPIYTSQWQLSNISAPAAWDITTGNSNITVAVIDTGFALNHQDMSGRWAENSNEVGLTKPGDRCWNGSPQDKKANNCDDDANGYIDDWRGWDFSASDNDPLAGTVNPNSQYVAHGTMTSGLVGATGNNGVGVASVNWGVKILPVQVLDDNGSGFTSTVAAGVHYAVSRGAKVISMSLGGSGKDDVLQAEIDVAIAQGVVVLAAAGNDGCDCMLYPANYPEVIAVGASDQSDNRASFSSYGPNLDVMAPGAGTIRTTYWTSTSQTSSYTTSAYGTSIATPIAAGLAALIKSYSPSATPDDVVRFMSLGADKVAGMGGSGRSDQYGYGRINAYRSLLQSALGGARGALINKHSVRLGSVNPTDSPELNSTCQTVPGASCDIKLTGPGGVTKLLGSRAVDDRGGANFNWNAASLGLVPGSWRAEAIVSFEGHVSNVNYDTFDVGL